MIYGLNEGTGTVLWSANAGATIKPAGEGSAMPWTGLAAAGGMLVVPASDSLVGYG